jgi:hypothetical protein
MLDGFYPARSAMMFENFELYLEQAWKNHWQEMTPKLLKLLKEKYGEENVVKLCKRHKVRIKSLKQ